MSPEKLRPLPRQSCPVYNLTGTSAVHSYFLKDSLPAFIKRYSEFRIKYKVKGDVFRLFSQWTGSVPFL